MHTTNLRKVGGSVMLAVPPAILDLLSLAPGEQVGVTVEDGRLVVHPQKRPRYTLEELLAAGSTSKRRSKADKEWTNSSRAGRELL